MKKSRLKRWIFALILAGLGALFLAEGKSCAAGAVRGLEVCARVVIPALFPFFVLSSMAVKSGLAAALGRRLDRISRPVFGAPLAAPAFILGILGGYPSGARAIGEMHSRGELSEKNAAFLLASCSNCGAAFILGAVGLGAFESSRTGIFLLAVHIAAGILTALVFRSRAPEKSARANRAASPPDCENRLPRAGQRPRPQPRLPLSRVFTESVTSALNAILAVCAYVVFFSVICALLPVKESLASAALTGFLEISAGSQSLSGLPGRQAAALAAAMTGWGGLCVHAQTLNVTEGIPKKFYFPGKILQAAISAALAWIFFPIAV